MNMPIPYDIGNIVKSSYAPSQVRLRNNATFNFFCRYFWQKIVNVFKFNLPETWHKDFFCYCLFGNGFVCVLDTAAFGVIPQWATAGGYNVFYEPRFCIMSNPLIQDKSGQELIIGEDCEVIKICPDWRGVADIIGIYAEKMALASQAIDVNLINSKLAYVFAAKNKQQAKSFQAMFDKLLNGEPSVVVDATLFNDSDPKNPAWQVFQQNLKQTYLASDLLSDFRKIEEEFDTKIGIPNANTDKRERMITDEVNSNNVETAILAEGWLEEINAGIKRVKKLFPDVEISVDWRYKPDVSNGEQSKPVNSGAVRV